MSAAAYNRGSQLLAREADERMSRAHARAERLAEKDRYTVALARIAELERDLARARRCIAELRRSKDARMAEAKADANSSRAAISILTRIAFPGDHP